MSEATQAKKYFDLHLSGLGYLSRVREVTSSGRAKAKPFFACSIAAFHGDPDVENGIVYLNLDLIVSGDKAKEAIASVSDNANDRDTKVLVGFRAGDHYISTYEIKKGDRAGQMGTVLKGRLLKVFWIKVNGELVYQDERDDRESDASDSNQADHSHHAQPRHEDDVAAANEANAASDVAAADVDREAPAAPAPNREPQREPGGARASASGFLRRSVRRTVRPNTAAN